MNRTVLIKIIVIALAVTLVTAIILQVAQAALHNASAECPIKLLPSASAEG